MKTYKVFEKGGQKVAVKQGWSWPGFFFHCIWAFTKGLLVAGIITLVVGLVLCAAMKASPALLLGLPFGIKGNKWWEAHLLRNGYSLLGTVKANNPAGAACSIPNRPGFPSINAESAVPGSFHTNAPENRFLRAG